VRGIIVATLLLIPSPAWPHAFPDHSEPRVGHTLDTPPTAIRIWFDGDLEPVFSRIRVENSNHEQVDSKDGRVNPGDRRLLEVHVPPLPPGKYRVVWSVVARDGHRTEGDYPFRIK
jgi:methionine-rich copper-binding protein CopC